MELVVAQLAEALTSFSDAYPVDVHILANKYQWCKLYLWGRNSTVGGTPDS